MISVPRQLLIQAVFIAINAVFAGLEMAMVSLNSTKLKMLDEEGDKAARRLLKMLENPAGFLSAIQVAISLSGFLGSAFAADSLSEPLTDWLISLGLDSIPYSTLNSISAAGLSRLSPNLFCLDNDSDQPQGKTLTREFQITNGGQSDLIIRHIGPTSSRIKAKIDKTVIRPGDAATLTVTLDSKGVTGRLGEGVTIVTNDPARPARDIRVLANIVE